MNIKDIKTFVEYFQSTEIDELEVEDETLKIKMKRSNYEKKTESNFVETKYVNKSQEIENKIVRSPLVGIYRDSQNMNSSIGKEINKGDLLCNIEAMKMMNEIHSPYSGKIKEVNYKDGDPIGYDEILIVLE